MEAGSVFVSVVPSLKDFAAKVDAETRGIGNVTINIDLGNAAETSARIDEAAHDRTANINVNADTAKADAELGATEEVAKKLDGRSLAISVTANTASALASIARVAVAADALDKRTLSPKINLDTRGIFGDLARVGSTILGLGTAITTTAAKWSAFSLAGAAAVKTIGSLGPVVQGAVGAAGLLPAVMTAGVATALTLKIGMSDVGKAVKDAFDPTKVKQFNQELAKLSPNAKATVLEIKALQPALEDVKKSTQDALFTGMAGTLRSLAGQYLPLVKTGFVDLATNINAGATSFAGWLQLPATFNLLHAATGNVTTAMGTLISGALVPAGTAFGTLAAVGTRQLPLMANAVAGVAQQFSNMINAAAASGALDAFFNNARIQLGYIFQVAGNVGVVLMRIFNSGAAAGGNLLGTLVNITGSMAAFLSSAQGAQLLTTLFTSANSAMSAAKPLLDAIGSALATVILPAIAQALPAIGAAFGSLAPAVAPFAQIIAALAPVLATLAGVVAQVLTAALVALAPIIQQLAPLFSAWAISIGGQLVGAIQVLAPLLLSVASTLAAHPQLVLAVISAIGFLTAGWRVLSAIVTAFMGPLLLINIAMRVLGVSLATLLSPFARLGGVIQPYISKITEAVSKTGLMRWVLEEAGKGIVSLLGKIVGAFGPIGALITIFTYLFTTNAQFRDSIMQLLGVFAQLIGAVVSSLQPVFTAIAGVLSGSVMPAVTGLASGLATALVPVIQLLAGIITALQPVLVPLIDAFLAIRGAVIAWTIAQAALDIALSANPIGLLVIAIAALIGGLVYAYQHFTWFRDIVQGAWAVIVNVASNAWIGLMQIFSGISTAVQAVGGFFVWLWTGVIVPAWNAIGAAISFVWTTILQPIFSVIGTVLMYIGIVVLTLLVAPFVIAWNIISAIVTFAWTTVIQPIFSLIGIALSGLGIAFTWLWVNVIVPVWNGIMAVIGAVWAWIQANVFFPIQVALAVLGAFFVMLWNNYVVPAWNGIMAVIGAVWAWIQANVFAPIQVALGVLGAFFMMLWNNYVVPAWNGITAAIGAAWNWIQSNVFAPIMAGLNLVGSFFMGLWNNYVVPAWNGIQAAASAAWNWIQSNVFAPLSAGVHAVGDAFGAVSDWIARTWDSIREATRKPVQWVVDVVYNNGIRAVWNGIAGLFGMAQLGPVTLATGGVLPGYTPGRDSIPAMLSPGEGVLVPEAVRGLGPAFVGWANAHFSGGRSSGGVGTPQGGGYSQGGIAHLADGGILGGIGDMMSGAADFFAKVFTDPVGAVRDLFAGVTGDSGRTPGAGGWTDALKAIPGKVIDAVVQKVKDWVASFAAAGGGNWDGVIAAALAMMGQPAGLVPVVHRRMMQESGGNPTIVNTTDSNWAKGTPSVGLMQVIGPTYRANRDARRDVGPYLYGTSVDPLSNMLASMHYALGRYGSLAAAYNKAGGYDSGGVASGAGILAKQTLSPERVLSPRQTAAFESLVPMLSRMGGNGFTGMSDDFGSLGNNGRYGGGATVNVYPSARMDEGDLAEAALHRLDWQMGLIN